MFSVFLAFVTQDDVMIKTMGIALAFGVLFDAFVVRLMIIPALTVLFGKASWYLPAWLNRILPKFDIEGHALSSMMPEEEYISDSEQARRRRRYSIVYEESKQTRELYQNLRNQQETTEPIIYNALILYAKTHYPDIYKRFNSHETTSNNQDVAKNNQVKSPQTTSAPRMEQQQSNDEEVLYELLKSQNKNISDMNALIHQLIQKNI